MGNNISILGKNIKNFRLKKQWSLNKLKLESGVGYATLHDLENGKSQNLSVSNLEKVATALNVNTMILLNEKEIELPTEKDINELIIFAEKNEFIIDDEILKDAEKYLLMSLLESAIKVIKYGRGK